LRFAHHIGFSAYYALSIYWKITVSKKPNSASPHIVYLDSPRLKRVVIDACREVWLGEKKTTIFTLYMFALVKFEHFKMWVP
jgi:hypothetical protein